MTDTFIDNLVNDLSPRAPLQNSKFWAHCGLCLAIAVVVILTILGLRPDHLDAMASGAMFWKPSIFLMLWVGAAFLVTDLSRPMGKIKPLHTLPLFIAVAFLAWQYVIQLSDTSMTDMVQSLDDRSAFFCLSVIAGGGAMVMVMAWAFWFSKAASPRPVLFGALYGFSSGSLVATAYAIHCDHDTALYISTYYIGAILLLSAIGAALGKKKLGW